MRNLKKINELIYKTEIKPRHRKQIYGHQRERGKLGAWD